MDLGAILSAKSKKSSAGENLEAIGYLSTTATDFIDIAISGDVAYCISDNGYFVSVDISDPSSPVELDYIDNSSLDYAQRIAIDGNEAYVNIGSSQVEGKTVSIDISDPEDISILDTYTHITDAQMKGIDTTGDIAIVVDSYNDNIYSLDITTPSDITLEDTITSTGMVNPSYTAIYGSYAFIVGEDELLSVEIINVGNIVTDDLLTLSDSSFFPFNIVISSDGNYIYLPCYATNTLISVNISNPSAMYEADSLTIPDTIHWWGIDIREDGIKDIIIITHDEGISSIDISDPSNMAFIETASYNDVTSPRGIAISGDYAYAVDSSATNNFICFKIA